MHGVLTHTHLYCQHDCCLPLPAPHTATASSCTPLMALQHGHQCGVPCPNWSRRAPFAISQSVYGQSMKTFFSTIFWPFLAACPVGQAVWQYWCQDPWTFVASGSALCSAVLPWAPCSGLPWGLAGISAHPSKRLV